MRLLVVSTADTELLAFHAAGAATRLANPARVAASAAPDLLDGIDVAVVRLLGGRAAWPAGLDALLARAGQAGVPVVCLGGEEATDPDLLTRCTVPAGVAAQVQAYLVQGGIANSRQCARFLSDTLLLTGEGFAPPESVPPYGVLLDEETPPASTPPDHPVVAIVFYRSHASSGNTAFVTDLAGAVRAAGGTPLPVYAASLRHPDPGLVELLARADVIIATVLAAGGSRPADAAAGGAEDSWDPGALATLDVPVLQGLTVTSSRSHWEDSHAGLSPLDAAMQVAIPEFDGRIVTVPFTFKEPGPGGVAVYRADPERTARLAALAVAHGRLRHRPVATRRVALVLSSYPTRHARVGNAVGLDTPASAVVLLEALADAGYQVGEFPRDSDALIHAVIASGGYDTAWLTEEQLAAAPIRVDAARYAQWFAQLPAPLRQQVVSHWGPAPGELYLDTPAPPGEPQLVIAGLLLDNVAVLVQPPRGFGENPVAIYHDPDLPPSHHYLAAYHWLAQEFRADAVVHLGKHGTLEWLPGKGLGLSAGCAPDAALGALPLIYPFIVNDPGEGTQAKRRAHAVVVDHLIPPMGRADTYGDLARLEQLLDEHAQVAALDPAKLPTLQADIWTLIQAAHLHHDLQISQQPAAGHFDDFLLHVDGYLCEVKDSQIRDGLHILGQAPAGEALIGTVLAILRAQQIWGGVSGALPGLRQTLAAARGLDEQALLAEPGGRADVDALEADARALVSALDAAGWDAAKVPGVCLDVLGPVTGDGTASAGGAAAARDATAAVLRFAATEVVPRLARTTGEIDAVLAALDGRFVEPGPSGSPTRGLVSVLPTGRNFYSVDPKAVPSRLAWQTGQALATSLLERHLADHGEYPATVGLTVWGTSAMRTQGDDIAEVLALLGVRPTWDEASRRVTGLEVVPLSELRRPRVDVVVRISGFFRDAFPHAVSLIDDAVRLVADLPEEAEDNRVRDHVRSDLLRHGDHRRATTRIFGSKPGAYGAGLLQLVDARTWRDDADLAEVYAVWGGYAYGRDLDGVAAREDLASSFARITVAVKNTDTREHDIADSDDYFQFHGGMVAYVRHLTGADPAAYVGDSAVPAAVRTRSLAEETRRVFRARVVNPRWIAAMMRHGYKGGFELAATVDYLFGFDATAGVVEDWMYADLATSYVLDPAVRDFLTQSNPWALSGIAERLLEAAERGLWAQPDPAQLEALQAAVLGVEADLEDR